MTGAQVYAQFPSPLSVRIEFKARDRDLEAGGVWGPVARKFFRDCVALVDDDRDVDLYHWSSTRFSRAWFDSLSVLVARGRAKVSAASAACDWPKRIREMQHIDVDELD